MLDLNQIEPLNISGLSDYHCHCDYSFDAEGTVYEYCEVALKRGLSEICFTTHWDTSPLCEGEDNVIRINGEFKPALPDNLQPYVDDVRRVGEVFYSRGLAVKLGLEFGWFPGCEEQAARLKERFDFDHFLCGIHELGKYCFCCRHSYIRCFEPYSVEQVIDLYAREVIAAARSGLFHCIAHLDYIRKFGQAYYGPALNDLLLERAGPSMFEALRESNTALEVNTSAIRRGFNEYFPKTRMVNAARRAGVNFYYLGSDAHQPSEVGFDFDTAAALVSPSSEAWCED
jgi:histidinol-phosphatase (PHP family)